MDAASLVPQEKAEVLAEASSEPAQLGSTLRHTIVLGLLIALGALGIDTYLPAFASIAKTFGVDEGRVQLSLVSYFIALAVGQLAYGPISDRIGRRWPLVFGFVVFVLASIGCARASSIESLIVLRFIQGIGACAGMVIPRAIVRDVRSGEEAARLFALMLLVLGVSPILAPMLGSLLIRYLAWQWIFWCLTIFGILCLLLIATLLEETLPIARRSAGGLGLAFRSYGRLIIDGKFVAIVMIGGLSQAVLFAYLGGSPFIYITQHHVPPTVYSLLFALNAAVLIGSAQFCVQAIRWLGPGRLVLVMSVFQAACAAALLAAVLLKVDTVQVIAICLFGCVGAHGLIGPVTGMLCLEPYPEIAGAASALSGAMQFACGAISSSLVSAFFNHTAIPLAAVMLVCAVISVGFCIWLNGRPELAQLDPSLALEVSGH